MAQELYGVNAITVADVELLLTVTSGGSAVHPTGVSGPREAGRAALHDSYFAATRRGCRTAT